MFISALMENGSYLGRTLKEIRMCMRWSCESNEFDIKILGKWDIEFLFRKELMKDEGSVATTVK